MDQNLPRTIKKFLQGVRNVSANRLNRGCRWLRNVWLVLVPTIMVYSVVLIQQTGIFSVRSAGMVPPAPYPPCPDYQLLRPGSKVLLISQGRSGSSFTSEIIDQDPDVFSVFEPLNSLMFRHPGKIEAPNEPKHPETLRQSYDYEAVLLIENFLSCRFESLQIDDITNFQLRNLPGGRMLWNCLASKYKAKDAVQCFLHARRNCLKCPVKLAKVVRFRGRAVGTILERNPDLKVIYLVRDPRGTISSQNVVFWKMDMQRTVNFTRYYCDTIREDLDAVEPLFETYPDRIKLLRYETLADDPIRTSQELYAFLGLNFTFDVRDFVYNRTHANAWSADRFVTFKANSSAAAYGWRKNIKYEVSQATDEACLDIYNKLGYLPTRTREELLNLEYKIKKDVSFHGKDI